VVEKGEEKMKRIVLALACCALSTGAFAQSQTSVPKEITGYKKILVSFSEGAKQCNLEDPAAYSARLSEKLGEIGIQQSDENLLVVTLGVSGKNFGMIGGHCVSMVELKFNAALSKDNIVTSDARARQAIDKLGVIPITLYSNALFGVQPQAEPAAGGPTTESKKAVLEMIDDLVESLKKKRM
jgi:hypothetical protein